MWLVVLVGKTLPHFREYDGQQHFKAFLRVNGMRLSGRHNQRLPYGKLIILSIYGKPADPIQNENHSVPVGIVGADFLTF